MKNKKPLLQMNQPNFKDGKELLIILKKNNIIVSPWIENIIKKKKFNFKKIKFPYQLYKINLRKDLAIKNQVKLAKVYNLLLNKNYKLVDPALALYSRIYIKNLNKGTWIRYATPLKSMVDSDGIPHLPKAGFALGKNFLETYWSYPNAIFHPHNSFIVNR